MKRRGDYRGYANSLRKRKDNARRIGFCLKDTSQQGGCAADYTGSLTGKVVYSCGSECWFCGVPYQNFDFAVTTKAANFDFQIRGPMSWQYATRDACCRRGALYIPLTFA